MVPDCAAALGAASAEGVAFEPPHPAKPIAGASRIVRRSIRGIPIPPQCWATYVPGTLNVTPSSAPDLLPNFLAIVFIGEPPAGYFQYPSDEVVES
jgi:hypothetical protein